MSSAKLDPRLNVFREDLAAVSLKEKVRAQRYVQGELRQIVSAIAPLRLVPRFDAPLLTEGLCGELVTLYEAREGWGWVQFMSDGYVGYMPLDNLSTIIDEPNHWVTARGTFVYPTPELKHPPILRLSCNSPLTVIGREGRFFELSRGGFIFQGHVHPIDEKAKDFVEIAERFVGVPYFWGGRSGTGIDCSGLVQISMQRAGLSCPRDSDMQETTTGAALSSQDRSKLQRGDLVFWRGHVGIMTSKEMLIHASGHQMEVVIEPLKHAAERIAETHGEITSIRRVILAAQSPAPIKVDPSQVPQIFSEPKQGESQQPAPPKPAATPPVSARGAEAEEKPGPLSQGRPPEPSAKSGPASQDRPPEPSAKSGPASQDRPPETGAKFGPASQDRPPEPGTKSGPASQDRPPEPSMKSGPSSHGRPPEPSMKSGPSSHGRPPETGVKSGPAFQDRPPETGTKSGPSSQGRPPEPSMKSGPASQDRPSEPSMKSGPSSQGRPPEPSAKFGPSSQGRPPETGAKSGPASQDRLPEPGAKSGPASQGRPPETGTKRSFLVRAVQPEQAAKPSSSPQAQPPVTAAKSPPSAKGKPPEPDVKSSSSVHGQPPELAAMPSAPAWGKPPQSSGPDAPRPQREQKPQPPAGKGSQTTSAKPSGPAPGRSAATRRRPTV